MEKLCLRSFQVEIRWRFAKNYSQKGVEGEIVGFSTVDDYKYHPKLFEGKILYEWVQMSTRCKKPKSQKKKNLSSEDEYKIIENEDKPQTKFKFKVKKYTDYSEAETNDLDLTPDSKDELSDKNISEYEPSEFRLDSSFWPFFMTFRASVTSILKISAPNFVGA